MIKTQNFLMYMEKKERFRLQSNDPDLEHILNSVFQAHHDELNTLFSLIDKHEQPADKNIDQYLFSEFNCNVHNTYEMYNMNVAIGMTEYEFFDLFSRIHEHIQCNFKKPLATVNLLKGVLKCLTIEQQIYLLDVLSERLETGDDWSNEEHPQAVVILHFLYSAQAIALEEYYSIKVEASKPTTINRLLFNYYLKANDLSDWSIDELITTNETKSDDIDSSLLKSEDKLMSINESIPVTSTQSVNNTPVKLSHPEIAILHHINGWIIAPYNANEIASKYGQNSGGRLYTEYQNLQEEDVRTSRNKYRKKNYNNIKYFILDNRIPQYDRELRKVEVNNKK